MNIKMVGLAVVIAGVSLCVMFFDSYKYMVAALTVVVFGFLIALIGYLSDVKKQKIINDRLDDDIERVIQPLITKYSNLNKQYSRDRKSTRLNSSHRSQSRMPSSA